MRPLDFLLDAAVAWRGTNTLHDPHSGKPAASSSDLTVTPLLGDRFVRLDYKWTYGGTPQSGMLLLGYQAAMQRFSGHWIDSWHMGDDVMNCSGAPAAAGSVAVTGTYAAPPGPDWGWRISISAGAGPVLRLEMVNIAPDGTEAPAVAATYAPA